MKKHEYVNALKDHLPINLIDKIIGYIYKYNFTCKEELKMVL